jgi:predicted ester cyclase
MGTPTNKVVAFDGMIIARVRGEQIVEGWNCIDFLTMYQQMGWVAAPVQPL